MFKLPHVIGKVFSVHELRVNLQPEFWRWNLDFPVGLFLLELYPFFWLWEDSSQELNFLSACTVV